MLTLTTTELEWIIFALNAQAEEYREAAQNQNGMAKALMVHHAGSLYGVAAKVEKAKQSKVKRIAISR